MLTVASAQKVSRTFETAGQKVYALREVDFYAQAGQLTVLRGRSGSGKTTLLNLLAGLDRPTQGEVWLKERPLATMSQAQLDKLRQQEIGMVFQSMALFSFLTAEENVELALRMGRTDFSNRRSRCREWLAFVGLEGRLHHRPPELSGGEQQRVAIARALVREPALLLADEPTAALDSRMGQSIIDLFSRLATEKGICVVLTTHDPMVMERAHRIYTLEDGRMAEDEVRD